jgi:hypothetical protein
MSKKAVSQDRDAMRFMEAMSHYDNLTNEIVSESTEQTVITYYDKIFINGITPNGLIQLLGSVANHNVERLEFVANSPDTCVGRATVMFRQEVVIG